MSQLRLLLLLLLLDVAVLESWSCSCKNGPAHITARFHSIVYWLNIIFLCVFY